MSTLSFSRTSSFNTTENGNLFNTLCETAIKEFLEDPETLKLSDNPFVQYVSHRKEQTEKCRQEEHNDPIEETQQCIREVEQKWTGSKAHHLREKVNPFVESITALTKSCENLLQPAPFGVAIAVSGFRIVLELATKAHGAVEDMVNVLEEISPLLDCYKMTAISQQSSPQISKAIKKSYKNILQFWAYSAKVLSKSYTRVTLSSAIRPFKQEIQTFREKFREDSKQVSQLLIASIAIERAREKQERTRDEILRWIRGGEKAESFDADKDLEMRNMSRTEGTCTWLFERQEFKDWRDAKKNSVLWYNGPPGSGKSVLASAVINHLQEQPESEVVHFFYSFRAASKRQETCGLRSIALQLLSKLDVASNPLKAEYERARKTCKHELTNNDGEVMVRLLRALLNHSRFAQVYVVLDGLDECSVRTHGNPLFYSLQQLLNLDTLGTVKWFLTSRDIPEIRSVKDAFKAVEIRPNLKDTSKDIRAFLDAQSICPAHDEPYFDTDEHNFLYAALICEIAKNKHYRTKQGTIDALQSFPRGLEDCYIKSLARIAGLPFHKQDLAKRTFRILTLSEKELTLLELIDGLNPYTDPANDTIKPKEEALYFYDKVKDVCSLLITMEDMNGSQKISLCHKSVKDFFIDPKNKEKIEEYLPDFFIDENKALEELGVSCIEYLSEERYRDPSDLKALVTRSDLSYSNAFLRYAAVFWHMHMQNIKPSSETLKIVEDFLKSPAFWTCIYVQSHAAPHLFARYKRETSNDYKQILGTIPNAELQFGLPLPPWKEDSSSADYLSLDRSFCSFALEWGELLVKNPDQLHHAVPLTLYKPSCHLKPPSRLQKVHIKYVAKLLESTTEVRVLESSFSSTGKKRGKTLQLRIIREDGLTPHRRVKVNQVDVFPRSKSDQNREAIFDSLAPNSEWITTIARDSKSGDSFLQSWKVNNRDLSITRCLLDGRSENRVDEAPPQVCRDLDLGLEGKGHWNLVQLDVVTQPIRKDSDPTTRLFYFRKGQCAVHHHERAKSPNNVIVSSSGSQDSSSDSDGESGWSSDSDDESDPSDTHSINGERNGSQEGSDNLHEERKEPVTECLIMANDFGRPVWRPIKTGRFSWSRIIGTRHPTLPIVAVSYKFGAVDLLNDETGCSTSLDITEEGNNPGAKPVATSREVQFSPCGNYLTLLSVTLYQKDACADCQVVLSCFGFVETASGYSLQTRKNGTLARFSYRFLGNVDELPRPYIMTNWTAEHVVLALPPLTYSPKIIRISLSPPTDQINTPESFLTRTSTLSHPVFFPQSTFFRGPHIMYGDGGSPEKDSYLYLVLDTPQPSSSCSESTLRCRPGHFRGVACPASSSDDKRREVNGPVVMGWKVLGRGKTRKADEVEDYGDTSEEQLAWREWNDEDGLSEDVKASRSATDEYELLRGDFVGETYSVPIRSGLNWTKEGVLSC
ncbi:putative vegetatible incompatibility het-E-1 [Fusarium denticulatum]|uniref:Putative vegetatible incompatibility het-E-1 n=1 Tax=Fusarium denticulatum TaxID=48507 RepID=A0A8H5X594_9HYPO|nr:putative vegetatible incompatibility het-E-1 [Fusarium denticulatum]